jgi:hypothetical protein
MRDWRTLLRGSAIVFIALLAIYVPGWLGFPFWVAFVTAPIAFVVAFFSLGRNLPYR